jgi:hypothetical protein
MAWVQPFCAAKVHGAMTHGELEEVLALERLARELMQERKSAAELQGDLRLVGPVASYDLARHETRHANPPEPP